MMSADEEAGAESVGEMYEVGGGDSVTEAGEEEAQQDWSTLTVAALKAALVQRDLDDDETNENGTEVKDEETEEPKQEEIVTVTTADGEDENADVELDEFVEWNEPDGEGQVGETSTEMDSSFKVEVVDELKDDEEKKKDEEDEDMNEDHLVEKEENETKVDGELSVDMDQDKDSFYIIWQTKKLTVPFKSEIMKDMDTFHKLQTVIMYPVTTSDIYSDLFRKHVEQAASVELNMDDTLPGKPPKGYLKMKFQTVKLAASAMEELKECKEGWTIKNFTTDDSESHIMSKLRKEDCDRRGPAIYRLVYVGNLPDDVDETVLQEHFPDALQAIIPCNEESGERLGYAYLECVDEKTAYEFCEKYKDTELNGEKLYIIQAITEKKEKYGLLKDSLRLYWSEQIHKLQKVIDKPYARAKWEVADAEQKLTVLKRRLEKDERRREILHVACPEYVPETKEESQEADEKREKSRERRSTSSAKRDDRDKGSRERRPRRSPRRTPPRRNDYRSGPRGTAGNCNASSYSRREEVADKLVNQLQGLVTALTNKLPTIDPPRPLLEDLQLANFQQHLGASNYSSAGMRGSNAYGSGYSAAYDATRYSTGKRYRDDDQYGNRKRRAGDYGASSSRYGSSSGGPRQYNRSRF